jgi:hypothetical protein
VRGRVRLTNGDRLFFIQLYRWFPSVLKAITIVRPETLVRWHRAGFRQYWRWKSRSLGGRPQIDADLRALIRRMSVDNPLWGARASTASCSSSALKSLSPASRSIWSSDANRPPKDGAPSCVTMRRTSPPWTYSLLRPLASTCSMSSSSFDWSAETLSGSTSHHIRPRNDQGNASVICSETHRLWPFLTLTRDMTASPTAQRNGCFERGLVERVAFDELLFLDERALALAQRLGHFFGRNAATRKLLTRPGRRLLR